MTFTVTHNGPVTDTYGTDVRTYVVTSPPPKNTRGCEPPLPEEEDDERRLVTREQTLALLRARSALTSQPYGADHADLWAKALEWWSFDDAHPALVEAARTHRTVAVADIVHQLEQHRAERRRRQAEQPPPPDQPDGPLLPISHPRARTVFERGYLEQTGRPYDRSRGNPA